MVDASGVAGAEAFLRDALAVYASPVAAEANDSRPADRGTPAQIRRLFTPALAQSLIRDAAIEGGAGIGFDPVCMCNDDSALVTRSFEFAPQPDGRVRSTVSFDSFDSSGVNYPSVLIYSLEQTPAGWRVAEVMDRRGTQDDVSLLQTLGLN